jgi:hypothetical protein
MASTDSTRLLAAAKAAYPELWPDPVKGDGQPAGQWGPADLVYARQSAVDRILAAVEAYEAAAESSNLTVTLGLPEDARMVQQAVSVVMYLDENGRSVFMFLSDGEGTISAWLGMTVLLQDHILTTMKTGGTQL